MRIFVAGATGVIGRRVVPLLCRAGHDVTAIGRTPERRARLARQGAAPVAVSVFDRAALEQAMRGHDAVINIATHIPPTWRMMLPGAWRENDRIRREGSANLAHAAIAGGAARFIQESFAPIYPDRGDAWIDESTSPEPVRYNRSVLDAEASAAHVTTAGACGVVLRFASFYGPDAAHLADMMGFVRRGLAPLPGRPDAFVSSVSHDDAATAVVAALGARAGTYNVADDEPVTRAEYAAILATAAGVAPPKPMPAWMTMLMGSMGELLSRSLRITNGKLRAECGWAPASRSVRDGLPHALASLVSPSRA